MNWLYQKVVSRRREKATARWYTKLDVDTAILQSYDLLKAHHFNQADIDFRRFRAETPDQVGQGRVDGRGNEPDDEARSSRFTKAPHHRTQIVNAFQNQDRVLVEQAASLGETHGTTVAIEQRDAQFRLQVIRFPAKRFNQELCTQANFGQL